MKPARICFLIENDEDDREIFTLALEEVDSSISSIYAENGVKALEMLHNNPDLQPYFIFIDMNMPLMNGVQCLQEIKKIDRLANVPVYIYSTVADPKYVAEVKKLGAVDFVLNPSRYKGLIDILTNLLNELNSFHE